MNNEFLQEVITVNRSVSYAMVDRDTKEKIRKHLSDKNDVITEDDIRNIRTDIFIPGTNSQGGNFNHR